MQNKSGSKNGCADRGGEKDFTRSFLFRVSLDELSERAEEYS